jgi:glycosyltransferase involved in cell wall biosynthesis
VKIAWFTPLSRRSAIGEFSVHVTAELAKLAQVEIWTSDEPPLHEASVPVIAYAPATAELARLDSVDVLIYNLGDYLPFHGDIHSVSRDRSGIVILHDRVLHHLFAGMWLIGSSARREFYVERMRAYYGQPGTDAARASLEGERRPVWESDDEVLRYPLYEEGIANARGVVTHSESQAAQISAGWLGPVRALHLPCYRKVLERVSPQAPADSPDRLRLLSVGHLNPNKQVHRVVEMLAADPQLASSICYTVVGPDGGFKGYMEDLRRLIARHDDRIEVELLGWRPEKELDRLMREADVFVNLRHPVMEGSSASLMRQLAYARPVLCFGSGFFAEMPEDALVRVPPGDFQAAANALRRLVADVALRDRIGARSRALADSYDERPYAAGIMSLIEQCRRTAPALRLLDSVARELGEMRVDSSLTIFDEIAHDFSRTLVL